MAGACGLTCSTFGCFVVGSASCVAWLAAWDEVVWCVGSASVVLNQVVCLGGLAFLAPVAPGFIRQEFAACFEVCGIGCALRHCGLADALRLS